jgi:HAD superfamily hydrolase (TIGR01549 family)
MLTNYKVILWDFDGVIMDSMPIRENGFVEVLKDYPEDQVEKLVTFHKINGGLSRYVKFRYFFENIRGENVTDIVINELSKRFSEIMLRLLLNEELLIRDSLYFIKNNFNKIRMHIVSGSDGKELNIINKYLKIDSYFLTIEGSPTPKKEIVKRLLKDYNYNRNDVVLIGDSLNDLEAAEYNRISFIGYNNLSLKEISNNYIESFTEVLI